MKPVLECLGHQFDAQESHPVEAKFKVIQEASTPTDPSIIVIVAKMESFWGMRNFCGKFIPILYSIREPLHELLRIDIDLLESGNGGAKCILKSQ